MMSVIDVMLSNQYNEILQIQDIKSRKGTLKLQNTIIFMIPLLKKLSSVATRLIMLHKL